jgi:putative membrane protein
VRRRLSSAHPFGVALRGVAMGAADLVPGVSGGTMALILGIYPRLIAALGSLSRARPWRLLLQRRPLRAARAIDAGFLLALAAGIGVALLSLPGLLHGLLERYPASVYAVFFGLIAASAWVVVRHIRGGRRVALGWALVGAVGAFVLVGATPRATPDGPWILAGAGALAVSALLLPGVSGAFVLVLLGKYDTVLAALSRLDLAVIAPFAAGMAVGLVSFSRLLAAALRTYPTSVLGFLAGVLIGALRKVWPWQTADGPMRVATLPPSATDLMVGVLLALAAAALVVLLERAGASQMRLGGAEARSSDPSS